MILYFSSVENCLSQILFGVDTRPVSPSRPDGTINKHTLLLPQNASTIRLDLVSYRFPVVAICRDHNMNVIAACVCLP